MSTIRAYDQQGKGLIETGDAPVPQETVDAYAQAAAMFPPVPGGMVDTVRNQRSADQAQLDQYNASVEAAPAKFKTTVGVEVQGVPVSNGRTFVLAKTGGYEQILPYNDRRVRATITAPDTAVVICFSLQQVNDPVNALAAAGIASNGYLLNADVPLVTQTQGLVYAVNPSGSAAARVAVTWDAYPEGDNFDA